MTTARAALERELGVERKANRQLRWEFDRGRAQLRQAQMSATTSVAKAAVQLLPGWYAPRSLDAGIAIRVGQHSGGKPRTSDRQAPRHGYDVMPNPEENASQAAP